MLKIREAYFPETLADPHGSPFLSLAGNDNGRFSLVQKALAVLQRSHFRHTQTGIQTQFDHEPITDQRKFLFGKAAFLNFRAVFAQNSDLFDTEAFTLVYNPGGFCAFVMEWFTIHQFDEPIAGRHEKDR